MSDEPHQYRIPKEHAHPSLLEWACSFGIRSAVRRQMDHAHPKVAEIKAANEPAPRDEPRKKETPKKVQENASTTKRQLNMVSLKAELQKKTPIVKERSYWLDRTYCDHNLEDKKD